MRGRILVDGALFFTTDRSYPVLTSSNDNRVDLMLRRTGPGTTVGLENTYWKLTRVGDHPVTMTGQREPHLILNSGTRRATGWAGCNQVSGSYEIQGDSLTLGPMIGL